MRLTHSDAHLTYCTNIHPGETWDEVRSNLEHFVLDVKARVCPSASFGVGLRLSAAAARTLALPERLAELRAFLDTHGLYVFTINGFPYGTFHGVRVKEQVYQPDWRDERRVQYSDTLAELLAALLPDSDPFGTVSTVPGAFRSEVRSAEDVRRMADGILRHAARLHALRERTGKTVALAIEPEPCCYVETVEEAVVFFEDQLFSKQARDRIGNISGLADGPAEEALRRHLGICLDTCHAAVEYEDADSAIARLRGAGIAIGKVQLSAGLRIAQVDAEALRALRPYADDEVYLHQVIERRGSALTRYIDLPDAIEALDRNGTPGPVEWRVHFHVPIFLEHLESFGNTQPFLREVLAAHAREPLSPHLEVETYTWDVLPPALRRENATQAISRELRWVLEELGEQQAGASNAAYGSR